MLIYAIKSAIYLSIMYVPYMLMLRNESFFRFNRVLLLCILLLSIILPFCDFHSLAVEGNPLHMGVIEIGVPMAIVEGQPQSDHSVYNAIDWKLLVAYIYVLGVAVTTVVKVCQLAMLYHTIHKGVLWKDYKDGITICCHANNIVPFSWFSTIVISEQDYRRNAAEIIAHEMGHIRHYHSWDICLVNIIEVMQWMNPLVWILASSLRNVHEYEADDAVLRSGVNARQYQSLLIRKAVGASSYTFANSFNHSQLKKRFTMMFRKQSNPWMRTKGLYIIPVAVIALSAFATPELNNRVDAITENAPSAISGKGTTNSALVQEKVLENVAPHVEQESITEENDSIVLYVVDGKVVSQKEFNTIAPENIKAVYVLKNQDSIKKYTDKTNVSSVVVVDLQTKDEEAENVFDVVENMPQFPGGVEELVKYLSESIRYPQAAFEKGLSGRVLVEFIVEKNGSLGGVKTIKFVNTAKNASDTENATEEDYVQAYQAVKALMEEAERVVSSMPKWTPGTQNGKAVRVKYVIPISFNLQ